MIQKLRRLRTKSRIKTTTKHTVVVSRSNKNIFAQVIDPVTRKTVAAASTVSINENGTKTEKTQALAKVLAEKMKKAKIDEVVFDRNGYVFKGRVQTFAEALNENGINI